MTKTREETAELQGLDQIPQGMTEDREDRFWETHSLGDELLEQMEPFPDDFPLPPREERQGAASAGPAQTSHTFPIGKVVLGGLLAAGLLAVGLCAYRAMKAGTDMPGFRPTKYPHLRISPAADEAMSVGRAAARRAGIS